MSSPYKTAAFHTLGCKVNFTETSSISESFQAKGVSLVPFDQFADIYVINTCSVTENANLKCNRIVRSLKRKNPNSFIAITGCYAQLKPKELSTNKDVDLVVGTENKMDIADIIISDNTKKNDYVSDIKNINQFTPSYSLADRVRSFIKIQDGCDYNCSFCTIPMARGKSRSAKIDDILIIIEELKAKGFNEVVLSGINLGDFGVGTDETCYDLLNELNNISQIPRIRISSIEPNLLTNKIIDLLATSKKIMPHLHIPLQSGSNKILKLMKRRYTREFYERKIKLIKNKIPNISIGVDVITGFPSETENDFQKTYDLLNSLEVSYLHVFTYSERKNTVGATMKSKIPQKIRNERSKKLRALSDILKSRFIINNMDKNHQVLIESKDDEIVQGYTENYIKVKIMDKSLNINQLVDIKPTVQYFDHMVGSLE
tara:strand:+ start:29413 stop:30702 length:1290 start_codon:yes stop_codon:yes gene_type:complete